MNRIYGMILPITENMTQTKQNKTKPWVIPCDILNIGGLCADMGVIPVCSDVWTVNIGSHNWELFMITFVILGWSEVIDSGMFWSRCPNCHRWDHGSWPMSRDKKLPFEQLAMAFVTPKSVLLWFRRLSFEFVGNWSAVLHRWFIIEEYVWLCVSQCNLREGR